MAYTVMHDNSLDADKVEQLTWFCLQYLATAVTDMPIDNGLTVTRRFASISTFTQHLLLIEVVNYISSNSVKHR